VPRVETAEQTKEKCSQESYRGNNKNTGTGRVRSV